MGAQGLGIGEKYCASTRDTEVNSAAVNGEREYDTALPEREDETSGRVRKAR